LRIQLSPSLVVVAGLLVAVSGQATPSSSVRDFPASAIDSWSVGRLPAQPSLPDAHGSILRPVPAGRIAARLRDVAFAPSELPSPEGVAVEQVVVTSDALAAAFQPFADEETRRGLPTVVRTVSWIDENYSGVDGPARIRTFLRDAYDRWGTRYAVLGGDVEHVPVRYVEWGHEVIPTDLYYECLDREWNEDGDDRYGEPIGNGNLDGTVNDVAAAPDGTLWIATYQGVVTWDGLSFGLHTTADGLPSDEALGIAAAPDGTVWVATTGGTARWDGAGWTAWTAINGLPADWTTSVAAAGGDDAWIGTSVGIAHWDGLAWTTWGPDQGLPPSVVTSLALDGAALWIGTVHGAARLDGGAVTVYDASSSGLLSNWVTAVAVAPDGTAWFGHDHNFFAHGGLSTFDGSAWSSDSLLATGGVAVRDLALSPTGELWAATSGGLFHRGPAGDELLGSADGLGGDDFLTVSLDAAGGLAVGGVEGLSLGLPGDWTSYDETNGLPSGPVEHDDIDLIPELRVGRVPAGDAGEVAIFLAKLAAYRSGATADRTDRALFLGEMLFADEDGKDYAVAARDEFPAGFSVSELYESDDTESRDSVIDALNEGPGWVVHVGHGSYDILGVGAGLELLFNSHVDDLDSAGRASFYVVYACNSGGFDQDCTMEHLLLNPDGGAIATMSNSREAIAGIDSDFNVEFFEDLFAGEASRPCESLRNVRIARVLSDPDRIRLANWWRRMYVTRSYLGIPGMELWRGAPGAHAVDHPASVPFSRAPFPVTVTDATSGAPVAGATVCVSKGVEDWAVGTTDAAGTVTFDFRPESDGFVSVVVTSPGRVAFEATVPVTAPSGPNPVAEGWRRISSREGNVDPADWTVQLGLRNLGETMTAGATLRLTSDDPNVTVVAADGTTDALPAGVFGWTSPFLVRPAVGLVDGDRFSLTLEGTGIDGAFTERYYLEVVAPRIVLDGLEGADGTIRPRITNLGGAPTGPLAAVLTSLGAGVVIDSTGSGPSAGPGETVVLDDAFAVVGVPADRFELRVTAADGAELTAEIDREAPPTVENGRAEPRDGGALLTWDPCDADDLAGYLVYGRDPDEGRRAPWIPEFDGPVVQGARAEVDFAPGTSREFLILAVDESGTASPDSCVVAAHAAPPELPGWPVTLSAMVGPSPIVASDLDGDGTREILLGSMWEANAVHVFRTDGSEWADGDGDPTSLGIFGTTGERIHAAPMALDVDGDGSKEVFAASFDGSVHAWRTNDPSGLPVPLPGWPIDHDGWAVRSTPVPADLDGDGAAEIVTVAVDGLARAFETDGTPVPGWPYATAGRGLSSTPAVADLDGDGRDEIVFGSTDSTVCVVTGDGTPLPGWPVPVGAKVLSSPVLVDLDVDGDLEIVVIARDGRVWAFHHDDADGTPGPDGVTGWPAALSPIVDTTPSPAIADLDGDGVPEVVVLGSAELAILRADGSDFPGWPLPVPAEGRNSPVIADLDADGALDVLVGTGDRRLTAYRLDGSVVPGWPRVFHEMPNSTPFVADVDGDGDLDVALGADDEVVRVLDLATPATPARAPWPGYHGGEDLRGVYVPPAADPVDSPVDPFAGTAPAGLELRPAAPNPFRAATDLRFALPAPARARLEVFDVAGRRVATPVADELLPAGAHVVAWDGRDASGRRVASGVYFLRLTAGPETRTGKVLRLR
jgi:hypothetical protein